jgi:plastocyanin
MSEDMHNEWNIKSPGLRRMMIGGVVCLTTLAAVPGCSSSSTSTSGSASSVSSGASSGASTVDVKNFAFNAQNLSVAVGTKVTWRFEDSAAHTVKADDGSFKSDALKDGQTYDHVFNTAGTYRYICSIHQYMTGTVTVK